MNSPTIKNVRIIKMGKEEREESLNEKEMEIIKWLSFGKRQYEISEIMQIKTTSVHQYIFRIMTKFGTNTSAGVVAIALRKGIIN